MSLDGVSSKVAAARDIWEGIPVGGSSGYLMVEVVSILGKAVSSRLCTGASSRRAGWRTGLGVRGGGCRWGVGVG
jgi:hypothetical protein